MYNMHDRDWSVEICSFFKQIYKSTKCNDMQQTGYCPRGPFCAFAHVDRECHFVSLENKLNFLSHYSMWSDLLIMLLLFGSDHGVNRENRMLI